MYSRGEILVHPTGNYFLLTFYSLNWSTKSTYFFIPCQFRQLFRSTLILITFRIKLNLNAGNMRQNPNNTCNLFPFFRFRKLFSLIEFWTRLWILASISVCLHKTCFELYSLQGLEPKQMFELCMSDFGTSVHESISSCPWRKLRKGEWEWKIFGPLWHQAWCYCYNLMTDYSIIEMRDWW